VVGNPNDPTLPQVDVDNYWYAYRSVEWLHGLGHRRIGFLYPKSGQPHVVELSAGYHDAVTLLCGRDDPHLRPGDRLHHKERAAFLTGPDAPTALIVNGLNDAMFWRSTIRAAGRAIAADVDILIHVETTEVPFLQPGDAYHAYDPALLGMRAGEMLIEWIDGKQPPALRILVPTLGPARCDAREIGEPVPPPNERDATGP